MWIARILCHDCTEYSSAMPQLRTCTYLRLILGCCIVGEITMDLDFAASPTTITGQATSRCPDHCMCELRTSPLSGSLKQTLDCRAAGLTQVPDFENTLLKTEVVLLSANHLHSNKIVGLHTLSNLTELNLSDNSIYSIESLRIDVDGLFYLLLDHNEIDYLPNRSFMSSPNLIFLSLIGNKVEIMHEQAFDGLYNLQTLDLTGNRIYELNIEWFRSLQSLRVLRLHDNNIHVIQPNAFKFLHSLKTLDLSQNHIEHIYPGALYGLKGLHQLDLQKNHLNVVPTQSLSVFHSLHQLDLSGNYFARLETGAITNINVSVLVLTHMPQLLLIDEGAISSMPTLTAVALNDNPHLMFIDGRAFSALPNLNSLKIHANNLSVVEQELLQELPALKQLSFYANKIHCDCNVIWLIQELLHHGRNLTIGVPEGATQAEFTCTSPPSLAGTNLSDKRLLNLPKTCPPRILPLFLREYNTEFGASLVMDCRATGIPKPQTDWLLPGADHSSSPAEVVLLPTGGKSPRPHVKVSASGSLYVDYVQAVDQGQYMCLASNPHGRDERSTRINVTNIHANVIVMRITAHAITVTWRSTRHTHDYQILYRESRTTNVSSYQVIDIKPYMRSYTVSELKAETQYEFCIAVQHAARSVRINCTQVSTQNSDFLAMSIFDSRDYIIGGSIAGFIFIGILICALTHAVRRYNNRQRQLEELYTDNLSQLFLASMDTMSDTTPITYENRVAEQMFDDDDIDEIRNTASMASTSTRNVR